MDDAGRIVLPKPIRDRLRLSGGSEFELTAVGDRIELMPIRSEPTTELDEAEGGLLVIPASGEEFDAAAAVREERDERARQ